MDFASVVRDASVQKPVIRYENDKISWIRDIGGKGSKGYHLDSQQISKLQNRTVLENSLVELCVPVDMIHTKSAFQAHHKEKEIDDKGKIDNTVIKADNWKKDFPCLKSKNPSSPASYKNRKGGFSMSLSGALDDTLKIISSPPPPMPKSEGPTWGSTNISKGPTSLHEIQDEPGKNSMLETDVKTSGKLPIEFIFAIKPHSHGSDSGA